MNWEESTESITLNQSPPRRIRRSFGHSALICAQCCCTQWFPTRAAVLGLPPKPFKCRDNQYWRHSLCAISTVVSSRFVSTASHHIGSSTPARSGSQSMTGKKKALQIKTCALLFKSGVSGRSVSKQVLANLNHQTKPFWLRQCIFPVYLIYLVLRNLPLFKAIYRVFKATIEVLRNLPRPYLAAPIRLPKRFLNLSTRPPVLACFCLPV